MLTKGFKDEEQKRLDQILNAGLQLAFVPESWKTEGKHKLDELLLQTAKLSLLDITTLPTEELLARLKAQNFSFSNLEHFADILLRVAELEENNASDLAQKALAVYEFAQAESKTFSFGLIQKISAAKAKL